MALRLQLKMIKVVFIPQGRELGMFEQGVIVQGHLHIESLQCACLVNDQRINLDRACIEFKQCPSQTQKQMTECALRATVHPQTCRASGPLACPCLTTSSVRQP